mgnify:CR=1 FL=1
MELMSLRRTLYRGVFHIVAGSLPAIALLILPQLWAQIVLTAVTILLLLFEVARLRLPSLNKWFAAWSAPLLRLEEQHKFTGASYLLVGYLITVLVFPPDIAKLAVLFASLGDPAATIIGTWKGNNKMIWGKSVEGTAACLLVCLAMGVTVTTTLNNPPLLIGTTGAIVATLFEALPLRLNDNLTISIGSAAVMMLVSVLI